MRAAARLRVVTRPCGSNDTTVEIYGVGATRAGQGAIKLATAGVVFLTTEGPAVHPPISCYPHIVPGKYYCATGMNSCASAHKWLRDRMFMEPGGDGSAKFGGHRLGRDKAFA